MPDLRCKLNCIHATHLYFALYENRSLRLDSPAVENAGFQHNRSIGCRLITTALVKESADLGLYTNSPVELHTKISHKAVHIQNQVGQVRTPCGRLPGVDEKQKFIWANRVVRI